MAAAAQSLGEIPGWEPLLSPRGSQANLWEEFKCHKAQPAFFFFSNIVKAEQLTQKYKFPGFSSGCVGDTLKRGNGKRDFQAAALCPGPSKAQKMAQLEISGCAPRLWFPTREPARFTTPKTGGRWLALRKHCRVTAQEAFSFQNQFSTRFLMKQTCWSLDHEGPLWLPLDIPGPEMGSCTEGYRS